MSGIPGDGGLALADGELTGTHLSALGRLPPLVVFNACESARLAARRLRADATASQRSQGIARNLSLAETLLRAGLAHYVGTHWPVEDSSATAFASVFYASCCAAVSAARWSRRAARCTRAAHPTGRTTSTTATRNSGSRRPDNFRGHIARRLFATLGERVAP